MLSLCAAVSPAGQGPALRDRVTPHIETHADDGARQEDCEHHQGADQQVEEGVEDGAEQVEQKPKEMKHSAIPALCSNTPTSLNGACWSSQLKHTVRTNTQHDSVLWDVKAEWESSA